MLIGPVANVKGLDKVVVTFSSVLTHNSVNIPERIYYLFSTSMSIFFFTFMCCDSNFIGVM